MDFYIFSFEELSNGLQLLWNHYVWISNLNVLKYFSFNFFLGIFKEHSIKKDTVKLKLLIVIYEFYLNVHFLTTCTAVLRLNLEKKKNETENCFSDYQRGNI